MKKIDNIWLELEKEQGGEAGLVYRRYSSAVMPDVFVGLRAPQNKRCVAVLVKKKNLPDIFQWAYLKEFKVQIFEERKNSDNAFILAVLQNERYADLFSVLCEDLVYQVFNTVDEAKLIRTVLDRFSKWKTIFEEIALNGLTDNAQRELFGKLCFLRKLLDLKKNPIRCVEAWVGPKNAVHDFQHAKWAVEIKSDQGYDNQSIRIGNEKKLDTAIIPNLFLVHFQLDIRSGYGESLLDVIRDIRERLAADPIAGNLFDRSLHDAGFFLVHADLYSSKGYVFRDQNIYQVENGFPSITRKQLPRGVINVEYSVSVSECQKFCIDEFSLFNQLVF